MFVYRGSPALVTGASKRLGEVFCGCSGRACREPSAAHQTIESAAESEIGPGGVEFAFLRRRRTQSRRRREGFVKKMAHFVANRCHTPN
jgi:hypothetical protein